MNAREVLEHFRSVGKWVNWDSTRDHFHHGDPNAEVRGIATTWIASFQAIEAAHAAGANLLITHEPTFYPNYPGFRSAYDLRLKKRDLLTKLSMVVMRCHDTWDRMPGVGIPDAWADFLGFEAEPRPTDRYYKVCLVEGTAGEVARAVQERTSQFGADPVRLFGDGDAKVTRMAVGTGAITRVPQMFQLGADCVLCTDDGMNSWTGGLWAVDSGVPVICVNHATAEIPGMMKMAEYLAATFPGMNAQYVACGLPPSSV